MHELLVVLFNHYMFGIFTFCILIDGLCWPFSLYMTNLCYIICKKHPPWNFLFYLVQSNSDWELRCHSEHSFHTHYWSFVHIHWFIMSVKIIGTILSWILLWLVLNLNFGIYCQRVIHSWKFSTSACVVASWDPLYFWGNIWYTYLLIFQVDFVMEILSKLVNKQVVDLSIFTDIVLHFFRSFFSFLKLASAKFF